MTRSAHRDATHYPTTNTHGHPSQQTRPLSTHKESPALAGLSIGSYVDAPRWLSQRLRHELIRALRRRRSYPHGGDAGSTWYLRRVRPEQRQCRRSRQSGCCPAARFVAPQA